jgi:tetratricopeptide (TPR) repeat protein
MDVRFEPGRVVEVWAPADGSGTLGSGYLLGDGLVLTAGHVVDRARGGHCETRRLGTSDWLPARRVWRGERCDAALLRLPGIEAGPDRDAVSRLGQLGSDQRAACRALGFPFAQAKDDGELRDTEDVDGEIAPSSAVKSGLLTVHIAGSVPIPDRSGHSPWEGMSGAAVFSGPLIVGLIVVDPARFGTDRLEAVPATAMADEPAFREVLTGDPDRPLRLPAIEDVDLARGVLDAPYRPLPVEDSPEALRRGATAFLLEPAYGIAPFHGRDDELAELDRWCGGEQRLVVRLLTARGGTGKTRLAAELCRRRQAVGDVAGFLNAQAGERVGRLAQISAPMLVVIDEAQSHIGQTCALLRALARARRAAPARVLLLARQAGDWWPSELEVELEDPDARVALAAGAIPHELPSFEGALREDAFLVAAHAFAGRLGRSLTELRQPDLTAPVFEPILFVQLAALSSAEGETRMLLGQVVSDDLLSFALQREARYWVSTARAQRVPLPQSVLRQAVAVATLTTARTLSDASAALAAIPDLADASEQRRNIARWLRDIYSLPPGHSVPHPDGGGGEVAWFRPLAPDLLGEALIAAALADDEAPELASDLLRRASKPEQVHRTLTVLTQAARNHPALQRALRQALTDHLRSVWSVALTVAQETGDPIGLLLAQIVADAGDPKLAAEIYSSLPAHTLALRELAVVATDQVLRQLLQERPSFERDIQSARLRSNLAMRLSELGDRASALVASMEAVKSYHQLVDRQPDVVLPELAAALTTFSMRLRELGRNQDEALAVSEEAVTIRRALIATHKDVSPVALANALNSHSVLLGELARHEEALAASAEAVTLLRTAAVADPAAVAFELGTALNSHSNELSALGRHDEALADSEEAVTIYRREAAIRPDAFLPHLATTLNTHSNRLIQAGHPEEALATIEDALEIRRRLAAARPDAFLPGLANALNNQADRLRQLGRADQALEAMDEAVSTCRRLAVADPDAFVPGLARTLHHSSVHLVALERRADALEAVSEAISRVLPILERTPHALPDAGLQVTHDYVQLCMQLGHPPDGEVLRRMHAVLTTAGVLSRDE